MLKVFSSPSFDFLCPNVQIEYHKDFEESRDRGYTVLPETAEMERVRKNQEFVSQVRPFVLPALGQQHVVPIPVSSIQRIQLVHHSFQ